jgi:hypothetical protein
MFYGQCWKCGERWELGTASSCKCPEETTIDWKDYSIPVDKMKTLSIGNIKPNYNITFHRDGKQIGVLDFNGPEMTFTGDADESAKVFFDHIARSFKARLEQERADEREACAKVCEKRLGPTATDFYGKTYAAAIRARSNT